MVIRTLSAHVMTSFHRYVPPLPLKNPENVQEFTIKIVLDTRLGASIVPIATYESIECHSSHDLSLLPGEKRHTTSVFEPAGKEIEQAEPEEHGEVVIL